MWVLCPTQFYAGMMIFMTTFLSSTIHEQERHSSGYFDCAGIDGGFWAFVLHVLFDWKLMFFRTWVKGPVSTNVSLLDKYNFHPYGNKFFNYSNQKSQVPMLILHGLGLRSNPRIQRSLKALTVWAGLPAVYTKGRCVSKTIMRLYWLLFINLWWLLTRCNSLSSLKLFCLLSPPRIVWMHTIHLLPPYLWFSIATSLNTGYWISINWNLMAGVSWMGQAVLPMFFFLTDFI